MSAPVWSIVLLVAAGGAVGSVLRYLAGVLALRHLDPTWPWGTFAVNVLGCFVIGCLARLLGEGSEARLLLMTGVLGGFTTFSTFALESAALWQRGDPAGAMLYVGGTVVGTLLAVAAGLALGAALAR